MPPVRKNKDGFWTYIGIAAWGVVVFIATMLSLIF